MIFKWIRKYFLPKVVASTPTSNDFIDTYTLEKYKIALSIAKDEYIKSSDRFRAMDAKVNTLIILWVAFITMLCTVLCAKLQLVTVGIFTISSLFFLYMIICVFYGVIKSILKIMKALEFHQIKIMPYIAFEVENNIIINKNPPINKNLSNNRVSIILWHNYVIKLYNYATFENIKLTNIKAQFAAEASKLLLQTFILIVIFCFYLMIS